MYHRSFHGTLPLPSRFRGAAERTIALSAVLLSGLALVACKPADRSPATAPSADHQPMAAPDAPPTLPTASARLAPTRGQKVSGELALSETSDGVHISGAIQGLSPDSEFGFHIHEKGDCSAPDASSAGAHFNPDQQPHGNPTSTRHHAGDMLNLKSDAQGIASVDTTVYGVSLDAEGRADILGKSIVVHEKPDDYTSQPSGKSGNRVACGVIGMPSESPAPESEAPASGGNERQPER